MQRMRKIALVAGMLLLCGGQAWGQAATTTFAENFDTYSAGSTLTNVWKLPTNWQVTATNPISGANAFGFAVGNFVSNQAAVHGENSTAQYVYPQTTDGDVQVSCNIAITGTTTDTIAPASRMVGGTAQGYWCSINPVSNKLYIYRQGFVDLAPSGTAFNTNPTATDGDLVIEKLETTGGWFVAGVSQASNPTATIKFKAWDVTKGQSEPVGWATTITDQGYAITTAGTGVTVVTLVWPSPPTAGGVTATGTATIAGGVLTAITYTNPGSGYTQGTTYTPTVSGTYTTAPVVTSRASDNGGMGPLTQGFNGVFSSANGGTAGAGKTCTADDYFEGLPGTSFSAAHATCAYNQGVNLPYYSPWLWNAWTVAQTGQTAQNCETCNSVGNYIKFSVSGTSNLAIQLSQLTDTVVITTQIDTLPRVSRLVPTGPCNLVLASGLTAGSHTVIIWIEANGQTLYASRDAWVTPAESLNFIAAWADSGATFTAYTPKAAKIFFVADSIGAGHLLPAGTIGAVDALAIPGVGAGYSSFSALQFAGNGTEVTLQTSLPTYFASAYANTTSPNSGTFIASSLIGGGQGYCYPPQVTATGGGSPTTGASIYASVNPLNSASVDNWFAAIAEAYNAEYGRVNFGSQGFGSAGASNVPSVYDVVSSASSTASMGATTLVLPAGINTLFAAVGQVNITGYGSNPVSYTSITGGNTLNLSAALASAVTSGTVVTQVGAWSSYWQGSSRLVAGQLSPIPTYIISNHGANNKAAYTATTIQNFISALRAAAPGAKIIMSRPFGQQDSGTVQTAVSALSGSDPLLYFLDISAKTVLFMPGVSNPQTYGSQDGLHMSKYAAVLAGADFVQGMQALFSTAIARPRKPGTNGGFGN